MPERRRKYSPAFKDEAALMVVESSRSIAEVPWEIQVNETTLGNWVAKYRDDHAGDEPPLACRNVPGCGNWNVKSGNCG
jgi:transposase